MVHTLEISRVINEETFNTLIKSLNCVEYDKKGINLDINSYEVEPKCDIIFSDSFIIELEKGKYNQDIEVKIKD